MTKFREYLPPFRLNENQQRTLLMLPSGRVARSRSITARGGQADSPVEGNNSRNSAGPNRRDRPINHRPDSIAAPDEWTITSRFPRIRIIALTPTASRIAGPVISFRSGPGPEIPRNCGPIPRLTELAEDGNQYSGARIWSPGWPVTKCYSSCYSLLGVLGAFCVGWCRMMSRAVGRQIAASN